MLIRRETAADVERIRAVHRAAFARPDQPETPIEVWLVDALRADDGWIPSLSLVALEDENPDDENPDDEDPDDEDPDDEDLDGDDLDGPNRAGAHVVGHVLCSRASVDDRPVLGLGPLGVLPDRQGHGIGSGLMHAVLGAADALGESVVVLLGHTTYYRRFGFRPALGYDILPPDPAWGPHFQARPLSAYDARVRGPFRYAAPFNEL